MKKLSGERLIIAGVALWPFLFLAPYTFKYFSPGNDFFVLYYNYKAYYISLLADGFFPLWAHSEAVGFPLFSNPFVQAAYPFNLLYVLYYIVTGSLTPWDYSMFTVMAFSIYGVGLYLWLRRLDIDVPIAVTVTLVTLMSLKVTELIRFPNAAHSAAWMPWLLYAATLATDRTRFLLGVVLFGCSCLMLFTAGYPYFIIYTPFLIGPYILAMVISPLRAVLLNKIPGCPTSLTMFLGGIGLASIVAAILASPWLLEVQNLMSQTVDRGKPDFSYATIHQFGWIATLGSWIYPPVSPHEGWYYFGMITTLLVAIFLINLITGTIKERRECIIGAVLVAWISIVTYFTWGRDSVLFTFVWHKVPVLDQLRVWARMNIILVPGISLLLALALRAFLRQYERLRLSHWHFLLFALTIIIIAAQFFLIVQRSDPYYWNSYWNFYWNYYFKGGAWPLMQNFDERYFILMTLVSSTLIAVIVSLGYRGGIKHKSIVCAAIVAVSALDVGFVSNVQWSIPFVKQSPAESIAKIQNEFNKSRVLQSGTVDPEFGTQYAGALENWGFKRHMDFYGRYFNRNGNPVDSVAPAEIAAVVRLFGADKSAQRLFVSQRIDYQSPLEFMSDVDRTAAEIYHQIRVINYDGNTLRGEIAVNDTVWLSFIDNWDPSWKATINGEEVSLERLFGSYKSVQIPAGKWEVVFSYRPQLWQQIVRSF